MSDTRQPASRPIVPFLAVPTATGMMHDSRTKAVESFTRSFDGWARHVNTCSLLAFSFNQLYAAALNARAKHGITHFLMLHDDVIPQDPSDTLSWSHALFDTMIRHNLGVVSAVVAIKDESGLLSTGVDDKSGDPMKVRRFRVDEFPRGRTLTSADEPGLLINTGCMAIDLTKTWSERIEFHVKDGIRRRPDGVFEAWVDPEDWNLSRWLRRNGVRFGATAAFECLHIGPRHYPSAPAVPIHAA